MSKRNVVNKQDARISQIDSFLKIFGEISTKYGRSQSWYDYIDMQAISFANLYATECRDEREKYYLDIVVKYDEKTMDKFTTLASITMRALLDDPEQDFLGEIYHRLGLAKGGAGQVFTPYHVGHLMASINTAGPFALDKSTLFVVNDACCGAGCLLIAQYNVMREKLETTDPDWNDYVLFGGQDIDPLACKMCYIQMCCLGIPGIVMVGNALLNDEQRPSSDYWFTPKYYTLNAKAYKNYFDLEKE